MIIRARVGWYGSVLLIVLAGCSPGDGREVVRLDAAEGSAAPGQRTEPPEGPWDGELGVAPVTESSPTAPAGVGDRLRGTPGDATEAGGTKGNGEIRAAHAGAGRVVFLGTSLTAGMGLPDPGQAYPARVQEKIDSAGLSWVVVNAGVSGETSAGGVRRLEWVLEERVDVLVVELGANDGLRGHPPESVRENLLRVIDATRGRNPAAAVLVAAMEAPPNLGPSYTAAFRRVFSDVARERDATLIPFLLDGVAGVPELNQEDGIHPTGQGHALMAERVWTVLEPVLRELRPDDASAREPR